MKTGKRKWKFAGVCIVLVILGGGLGMYVNSGGGEYKVGQFEIIIDGTDKARYVPGEEAVISVSVRNTTEIARNMETVEINWKQLSEQLDGITQENVVVCNSAKCHQTLFSNIFSFQV